MGAEAIAVCFLHSYANPAHEQEAAALIEEAGCPAYVSLSHEILRQYREYERISTTVINSYVGPRMSDYLGRLADSWPSTRSVAAPTSCSPMAG